MNCLRLINLQLSLKIELILDQTVSSDKSTMLINVLYMIREILQIYEHFSVVGQTKQTVMKLNKSEK